MFNFRLFQSISIERFINDIPFLAAQFSFEIATARAFSLYGRKHGEFCKGKDPTLKDYRQKHSELKTHNW